jgi:hypothetical protein
MSSAMPAAWATPVAEPMQQNEYDDIHDDVRNAMYDDKALLPDAFWFLFQSLGTLAETSHDPDGFAAQSLRRVLQRAVSGVPMNEPEGEL